MQRSARFAAGAIATSLLFWHAPVVLHAEQTTARRRADSPADSAFHAVGPALMRAVGGGRPENLVLSPYSVQMAMAMVAVGAAGETERELVAALRLPEDRVERDRLIRRHNARLREISQAGHVTLESACRFWAQRGYSFQSAYLEAVRSIFDAAPALADFIANTEGARLQINGWVSDTTRRRIPELLPHGILDAATRLVLVNAVYFYGTWNRPFPADNTRPVPFHCADGREVRMPMMEEEFDDLRYTEEPGLQVCELPYRGGDVAMTLLLPAAGGLAELEGRIERTGLAALRSNLARRTVRVILPRFKIETQAALNDPLRTLGVKKLFEPGGADLSGINGQKDLFVSHVVHKAVIEVHEKGTEAAAATAVAIALTAAPVEPPPPVVFRADRPFLFALVDARTGLPLFLGRFAAPPAD